MRTPEKYKSLLAQKIISKEMLADCLYSLNKRAKNHRDRIRGVRKYVDTSNNDAYKKRYYDDKEFLLKLLVPSCVHREFAGYEKMRIYDYDAAYWKHKDAGHFVWENRFYSDEIDDFVYFGDLELKDRPKYRYYLFYDLGTHSFHTPIPEQKIPHDLRIVGIDELDTFGADVDDLLPVQFVNKVLRLVFEGDYVLTFKENVAPKQEWTTDERMRYESRFVQGADKEAEQGQPVMCETAIGYDGKEISFDDFIIEKASSAKYGANPDLVKETARQAGMEIKPRTTRAQAMEWLKERGSLEQYADLWNIGVTKFDFNRCGMSDAEYNRYRRSGVLVPLYSYDGGDGFRRYKVSVYPFSKFAEWRRTGTIAPDDKADMMD